MTQTYYVHRKTGAPWHERCIYPQAVSNSYVKKNWSKGSIDPAALFDETCGYCHDFMVKRNGRLEPIVATPHSGCLNCGPKPQVLPMDFEIAVGFGCAMVTKDGECVLDGEEVGRSTGKYPMVAEAERMAARDPDHDWRIVLDGPLGGQVYQRHDPEQWAYVVKLPGFA